MPRSRLDHEVKFLVDAEMYLSIKHEAENDDRGIGEYVRHVLHCHFRRIVSTENRRQTMPESGLEPAESGGEQL